MSTRDKVPDAWDDDWVNKADVRYSIELTLIAAYIITRILLKVVSQKFLEPKSSYPRQHGEQNRPR